MQKRSFFNNQTGFILPYVVFVSALILITLSASIHMYHNEIHMTDIELENIQSETLLQMGYAAYIESTATGEWSPKTSFTFPQGRVQIQFVEEKNILNIKTTTSKNHRRTFVRPFTIPKEEESQELSQNPQE